MTTAESAATWSLASVVCVTLAIIVLLSAALRVAKTARTAYDALSRAHEDLRRRGERLRRAASLVEHERYPFAVSDALSNDLTSILAQIQAARCVIGPAELRDPSATGVRAAPHLARAHERTLHLLHRVRRAVR
jgi:hypothetical protein